jgi:hypothetical protein
MTISKANPPKANRPAAAKPTCATASRNAGTSKKPKRISPMSAKRKLQLILYVRVKALWWQLQVLLADDGIPRCQVPGCDKAASRHPSHRYGRIGSLLCEYRLFDRLCSQHYNWLELHPEEARFFGLLCQKGLYNTNPYK